MATPATSTPRSDTGTAPRRVVDVDLTDGQPPPPGLRPAPLLRRASRRARRIAADWGPAIPFLLFVGSVLIASAVWLVVTSVRGTDGSWTLAGWREVFASGLNREAIGNTVQISLVVATISVLVATPVAWYTAHLSRRGNAAAVAVCNVVNSFGGASLAAAFIFTYGTVGFLRLLADDWIGYDLPLDLYGFAGLVLIFCYAKIPLCVLLVLPAMSAVQPAWWEAAQTLTASQAQFWRRVGLPVLAPFIIGGWVLSFAFSVGQFAVPFALVGADSPYPLVSLRIYALQASSLGADTRMMRGAVLAVLLIVITTVALLAYRAVTRPMLRRLQGGAA